MEEINFEMVPRVVNFLGFLFILVPSFDGYNIIRCSESLFSQKDNYDRKRL